jgi:hypothetical protein
MMLKAIFGLFTLLLLQLGAITGLVRSVALLCTRAGAAALRSAGCAAAGCLA